MKKVKKHNIIIANISEVSEVDNNDFNNDGGASQENTTIVLEEKDIPGAALLRPLEACLKGKFDIVISSAKLKC